MSKKDTRGLSNSWSTPDWLFKELSDKYGPFDIDLCATKDNSKCGDAFYIDYLTDEFNGEPWPLDHIKKLRTSLEDIVNLTGNKTCWMNPPYSNPLPFIEKAWHDSQWGKIVLLVKVDSSTKWWSVFWEYSQLEVCSECENPISSYGAHGECHNCGLILKGWEGFRTEIISYNGPKPGCNVQFLPKRVHFDPPKEMNAWKEGSKWYIFCQKCDGRPIHYEHEDDWVNYCVCCKGTGKKALSGPSFPVCVIIFDRRGE